MGFLKFPMHFMRTPIDVLKNFIRIPMDSIRFPMGFIRNPIDFLKNCLRVPMEFLRIPMDFIRNPIDVLRNLFWVVINNNLKLGLGFKIVQVRAGFRVKNINGLSWV